MDIIITFLSGLIGVTTGAIIQYLLSRKRDIASKISDRKTDACLTYLQSWIPQEPHKDYKLNSGRVSICLVCSDSLLKKLNAFENKAKTENGILQINENSEESFIALIKEMREETHKKTDISAEEIKKLILK